MIDSGVKDDAAGRRARRWSLWMVLLLQGIILALCVRSGYLQIHRHEHFVQEQNRYLLRAESAEGERGKILCAGGETLVRNRPYWRIILNPKVAGVEVVDAKDDSKNIVRPGRVRAAVRFVDEYLDLPERPGVLADRALVSMDRKNQYFFLTQTDDEELVSRFVRQLDVFCRTGERDATYAFPRHSIVVEERYRREYPYGSLALQLLGETRPGGQVDVDGKPLAVGVWGVELDYDRVLCGVEERPVQRVDGKGRKYGSDDSDQTAPGSGADLTLTIDLKLQFLVEECLQDALIETRCRRAVAAVLDPDTGAVLAAACAPSLQQGDARRLWGSPDLERRMLNLDAFHYEPGSTIKPLILTEAIERGIDLAQVVTTTDKKWNLKSLGIRRTIKDSCPDRDQGLTISESVVHSSNIGMARLGLMLEEDGLRAALGRFGLKRARDRGRRWNLYSTTSLPMGYELFVTPMQLLRAYCAIANGGYAVEPHVVAEVDGRPTPTAARDPKIESNRLASAETMRRVRSILRTAAVDGTGRHLKNKPDGMAAKTGTAYIWENGQWLSDGYRSSMVAFAPWESPEYLVYVRIDRPVGQHYGAQVAGPVARDILAALMKADENRLARRLEEVRNRDDFEDRMEEARAEVCPSDDDGSMMETEGGESPWSMEGGR